MSCLILPFLVPFLSESGDHSLLVGQVAAYRCYKIRFNNKKTDWNRVFCGGILLAFGSSFLAKGSCSSTVLCDVWRIWIPVSGWHCIRFSLHRISRICYQLNSLVHHKKVLLNRIGRIWRRTENCHRERRSIKKSGIDRTQLRISNLIIDKVR